MKAYRSFWTVSSMCLALVAGLSHIGAAASPGSKLITTHSQPTKLHPFARPAYDKTPPQAPMKNETMSYGPNYEYGSPGTGYEDIDDQPVALDSLDLFVQDAYRGHSHADFSDRVELEARVVSSILPASNHHHRVLTRIQPDFPGYFVSVLHPTPRLEYVEAPFFEESVPYSPEAPLKDFVIIEVSGEIDFMPLDYEAFLFKFVSPEGFCQIKLMDPVFPGVSSFADDDLLSSVFPDCEGPQATRSRLILAAAPRASPFGRLEAAESAE